MVVWPKPAPGSRNDYTPSPVMDALSSITAERDELLSQLRAGALIKEDRQPNRQRKTTLGWHSETGLCFPLTTFTRTSSPQTNVDKALHQIINRLTDLESNNEELKKSNKELKKSNEDMNKRLSTLEHENIDLREAILGVSPVHYFYRHLLLIYPIYRTELQSTKSEIMFYWTLVETN
jgi:hypothetical protein